MLSSKSLLTRSLFPIIKRSFATQEPSDHLTKVEKSINLVTLLGRVGAEPQKRGTNEHPVVIFPLATNTNYRYDSGDITQKTEWHRVCVFKPTLRETVYNFMKKGQRVHVTGKLNYSEIKDDQGNTRPTTSIIAEDVIFFQ